MQTETQPRSAINGKILHVNLSTVKSWVEELPLEVYRLLVGGRGLIAYLLLRDLPAGADPLSPQNLLIFAPGILQGTSLPGAGRHAVGAKSPLTGAIGSSEAGGWWGHEFKCTGYDALVVHGRADQPVYLWIKNDQVEVRPAAHLWGQETAAVQAAICHELDEPKARLAQIGMAGENGVLFASIMHDINRAAGRNGLGAVMGSKNLKAVAVRGTHKPEVADRKRLTTAARWLGENYQELTGWAVAMGTPGSVEFLNSQGGLPTRNFQLPQFDEAAAIGGAQMHKTILKGRDTCMACPITCKQVVEHQDPSGKCSIDPVYGGPEYETLAAFGSNCLVSSLVAVAKANERCNAYGLDTISTGMTIAFVMECVERGLLTADMTGGYLPRWGSSDDLLQGIEMIAHRQGFGERMAEGSARLAAEIGAAEFALTVKQQEMPLQEPRLKVASGIGYAVSPIGADHNVNIHDTFYSFQSNDLARLNSVYQTGPLEPDDLSEAKLNLFFNEVNFFHFLDCAVSCIFHPYHYEHYADALSAASGFEYSVADVLAVGQRAQTLSRLFNYREGFSADDDLLPARFTRPFESGPLAGKAAAPQEFESFRRRYYTLMGWDAQTGKPTEARLKDLGLKAIVN